MVIFNILRTHNMMMSQTRRMMTARLTFMRIRKKKMFEKSEAHVLQIKFFFTYSNGK